MRLSASSLVLAAALSVAFSDSVFAHGSGGGRYRGPGDVVPPPAGGTPGRTGPTGPSTPGPSTRPATGGPAPSGARGPTTGGIELSEDYTQWHYWWSLNLDRYLGLKDAVHATGATTYSDAFFMGAGKVAASNTLRPTDAQVHRSVLPLLHRMLTATDDRDIVTGCMVALAKFGQDHEDFQLLPLFRDQLSRKNQEIRETAALSIGIGQQVAGLDDLIALLHDTERGRKLSERSQVDDRTRAFAAYGIGLISRATRDIGVKRRAFEALRKILEIESMPSRDIRVGVISGIGLIDPGEGEAADALVDDALAALETYASRPLGPGDQWIQAHVPTSVAKLLEKRPPDARRDRFVRQFVERVSSKKRRGESNAILQSAVLALGVLAGPYEDDASPDRDVSKALLDYYKKGPDKQAGYFALIALGQIGGAKNRDALLDAFRRGSKALERPWAALALGVYCHPRTLRAGRCDDPLVGRILVDGLESIKNPSTRAAIAIAIGLCGYTDGADAVREQLVAERFKDGLSGSLCTSLALLRDQRSVPEIRAIVDRSLRRPALLRDSAIALGILGDKSAGDQLIGVLGGSRTNVARMASVSVGLGMIGDRRTIDPLVRMSSNESLTDLTRAFAIVALGNVIDKGRLPWNEPIGRNINYRANVPTLIDYDKGILDIL